MSDYETQSLEAWQQVEGMTSMVAAGVWVLIGIALFRVFLIAVSRRNVL